MLSGNEAWSLISLGVAMIALALGVFVAHRNHGARAAKVFIAAMALLVLGGCVDFLFMNAPSEQVALPLARLLFFLLVMSSGAFFYLSTFLPYESSSGWFQSRWWALFLPIAGVALLTALLLTPDDVDRTSYGWGVGHSLAMGLWAAAAVFLSMGANIMLATVSRRTEDKKVRAQIAVVGMAVSAPVLYGLAFAVLEELGADLPPVLSPGYLLCALIMAYAVLRHRLFLIDIPRSGARPANHAPGEYGLTQLFLEKKGERAFRSFESRVGAGDVGAIISRAHPDLLRERYRIPGVPIIWLAEQPGDGRVDPKNLSILQHSMLDLWRRHEGAMILLEGVEYLLSHNTFESVLRMLYALDDEVVLKKGLLILTLDPDVMSEQGLAMFVRDFHLVE